MGARDELEGGLAFEVVIRGCSSLLATRPIMVHRHRAPSKGNLYAGKVG